MRNIGPNKIHIIGSVGSGKTTLAKLLSKQRNIPYCELDNVVWDRTESEDRRRTDEQRDKLLKTVISKQTWIIEGSHHKWVSASFAAADVIIFLNTNYRTRQRRIIKRFLLQKLTIEKAHYKPTWRIFYSMFKWNKTFEYESKQEIIEMLHPYGEKVIVLKDNHLSLLPSWVITNKD
ncbi:AAA family ATPase [Alkalihalobacillus sp. LMS39]|uniref:AAA family ATPase n=1 Tax=Alkalihalobacillus sp. LMS39 TaxID=2924032 RepID=UPI001FB4F103|nr:AAA family ATPase [Alkalihalobacillus sp. LMS39]UOE94659.1 AAA family ATPase [Alkalihalobacillus sp. LMS39]